MMPPNDDIRDLMGRYATGTLSDAERRRLFDAALEDQDLFDELSREHSLKQLMDSPGVRDRLIASLAPPEPVASGWKKNLTWALAATFVIGMSLTAVLIMRNSLHSSQQIAQLETPPPASSPISTPTSPPTPQPAVSTGDVSRGRKGASSSPTTQPPSGAETPSASLALNSTGKPDSIRDRKDSSPQAQAAASVPPPAAADGLEKRQAEAKRAFEARPTIAPAAMPPPPPQPQGFLPSNQVPSGQPAVQVTTAGGGGGRAQPGQSAGITGGVGGAAPRAQSIAAADKTEQSASQAPSQPAAPQQAQVKAQISQAQVQPTQVPAAPPQTAEQRRARNTPVAALAATPPKFSFTYSVEDQDVVFKFARDGYFSIHFTPGQDTIVDSRVTAGSTRRERMPNNTTEIYITYSAKPQSLSGGLELRTMKRADTLTDPEGQRIELMIRLYQ